MRSPFTLRSPFRPRSTAAPVAPPPPPPPTGDIIFGADTYVGDGSAACAAADGTYGPFTVAAGRVSPNTSPITPNDYAVGDQTVTVVADVITVSGTDELVRAIRQAERINNKAIEYRRNATYGEINNYGAFDTSILTGTVTIRPCNEPGLIPPWQWFAVTGPTAGTFGNVILDGVHLFNGQDNRAHNFISPQESPLPGMRGTIATLVTNSTNVTMRNCDFSSNMMPSKSGGLCVAEIVGLRVAGSNHVVENCKFHHVAQGVELRGSNIMFRDNEIYDFYSDGIRVRDIDGVTIVNNTIRDIIGLSKVLHQDAVQFIHDAANVTIEGNVIWPGDYANRVITTPPSLSVGDQFDDRFAITADLTLTEAEHNGKTIRANADGLTVTLPASPTLGETYWFMVPDRNHTLTVLASGGQTHGDGMLPRTVDHTQNQGTFAVFWDGTQWQTRHGLRAGIMNVTAGTLTLTPRFSQKNIALDASAGDITVTLPPMATMTDGVGFFRLDNSANTVTILPDAGDTFEDGSASLNITQDQSYAVRDLVAPNVWRVLEGNKGELQGIFGNNYVYSNIKVRGNVLWLHASHHNSLGASFDGQEFESNTFMRPIPPNVSGDGVTSGQDGFFNLPNALRFRGANATSFARRTVAMAQFVYNYHAATDIANSHNIELNITDPTALPTAHFNGTTQADYYPLNKDQALSMALAKVGGPLDGSGIGALGTTISNGYWDYATGAPNPGYVAPPDPVDPDPVDPTPATGFGLSIVPADVANAAWAPQGGWTKTVTDGWLIKPAGALRADTDAGTFTVATSSVHTFVVDVRKTAGGSTETVNFRTLDPTNGTGFSHLTKIINDSGVVTQGTASAAGSIDMGNGIWRFWWKATLTAGNRLLVQMPNSAASGTDLRNPAIFASDLTVAEITALT